MWVGAASCIVSVRNNNKNAIKQIADKYERAVCMPSVVADIYGMFFGLCALSGNVSYHEIER